MKGKIIVISGNQTERLRNLQQLMIRDGEKLWVYAGETAKELLFKTAPMSSGGVGNYIKQWRKREKDGRGKPLTQAQAAKALGISQSMMSKMETGERELSPEIWRRIRAFNKAAYGEEQRRKKS